MITGAEPFAVASGWEESGSGIQRADSSRGRVGAHSKGALAADLHVSNGCRDQDDPPRACRAAAAAPPAASPPTPSPGSGSSAVASCLTRDLTASVGSPQGSAAGLEIVIMFKNLGKATCTLSGYPGVAQAAGTPDTTIGQPSTQDPAAPRKPVTLPPNGVASAMLRIADPGHLPAGTCEPVKAISLAVSPPDQKTRLNISFGSTACKGKVNLLSVSAGPQGSGG